MSMDTTLGRVITYDGGTPASKSCGLLIMGSRDTSKKLYLLFHNMCSCETWLSGNIRVKDPNH